METAIATVDDVIDRLGGPASVARALGFPYASAVTEMKRRGSIPVAHWPALMAEALRLGVKLDERILVAVHVAPPVEGRAA